MVITAVDIRNLQPMDFWLHREHGRSDYLFVLFQSPAMVFVEGQYVPVDRGDCILFDKHRIQSYYPCRPHPFLHDFMHFDLESEQEALILSTIPMGTVISLSHPEWITAAMQELREEQIRGVSAIQNQILSGLGLVFLHRIRREVHSAARSEQRPNYAQLHRLREAIYADPSRNWTIETMCKTTCLSRSYFQHLYKTFFEVSCTEDVIRARLSLARNLLLSTSLRITEIAERCGYQNVTHFIRQFRSRTGQSPNQFRFG